MVNAPVLTSTFSLLHIIQFVLGHRIISQNISFFRLNQYLFLCPHLFQHLRISINLLLGPSFTQQHLLHPHTSTDSMPLPNRFDSLTFHHKMFLHGLYTTENTILSAKGAEFHLNELTLDITQESPTSLSPSSSRYPLLALFITQIAR